MTAFAPAILTSAPQAAEKAKAAKEDEKQAAVGRMPHIPPMRSSCLAPPQIVARRQHKKAKGGKKKR